MKLNSVTLENVKSFRDKTTLKLDPGMNVLVGPNGGGKSNLLDAINVIMRQFVLPTYSIKDVENGQFRINKPSPFDQLTKPLPKYSGYEEEPQILEFEITFEESDCENTKRIMGNIKLFSRELERCANQNAFPLESIRKWNLDLFEANTKVTIQIEDGKEPVDENITPNFVQWREYLTYFELFSFMLHQAGKKRLHSVFLYIPPLRGSAFPKDSQAKLTSITYSQALSNYFQSTSKSPASLIEPATLYFAEKRRMLESKAFDEGFGQKWQDDEDVKLVSRYFKRLGYNWSLESTDPRRNLYQIHLTNNDIEFDVIHASSGEKEIVNYILGIFALNPRNGLLVIDEVELHLHPQWQTVLLDILFDLAKTTRNQIIISTHSPMFVTPLSITHVVRVYKQEQISRLVKIENPQEQSVKDTIHIVNAHNNAKIFFADYIILVEGIQDRLIFERIVELFRAVRKSTEIIQVLEVTWET